MGIAKAQPTSRLFSSSRMTDLHDHPTRGQSGDHDQHVLCGGVGDLVTLATPRSTTAYVYDPRIGASGVLTCSSQHPHLPLRVVFPSSAGKMLRAAPRSSTADFSVKLVTRAYHGLMFRS